MTEAILNNIFQAGSRDFRQPSKTKTADVNSKSFAEKLQEINQHRQQTQTKPDKSSKAIKEQSSTMDNQEFLKKLKDILSKNNKEVPSELISLLQGGSLSKQQEAMLGKLMLNLKNNDLDISELKSLLARNSDELSAEAIETEKTSELLQFLAGAEAEQLPQGQSIKADDLEKIASMLEAGELKLNEEDSLKLKDEIEQLAEVVLKLDSGNSNNQQILKQLQQTENLEDKLAELISLLKESDFQPENLEMISEEQEIKTPLLSELINSANPDFTKFSQNLNSENPDSLFAELAAQMKEILEEENSKVNVQETENKVDLSNSDLLSLDTDSNLDFALKGSESENKNQNNFFDLDNSKLLFNFENDSQSSAGNVNLENFSLNSDQNTALPENVDLRSQVVEQFRGEYSPETKEMQIQLEPESLGKIDISLSYDNDELTGRMLVESEVVRSQLENSLKDLKTDLLKQGINIEQFKIETAKNGPQQVERQADFSFGEQNAAFADGETGQNQEYEQRQFFQGQYYVQKNNNNLNLDDDSLIMRQQDIINRAAFSSEKINLLA
ncbi:MAG: flagellar hook-length control protein FliK [Halanaerobium sp.]